MLLNIKLEWRASSEPQSQSPQLDSIIYKPLARITYHVTNAGKEATGSDLSEYRVVNGKIVEDWPPSGTVALLQRVGVTLPSE
jgi:predicted SnoaL-like aldol condensation-catalyzing enzyme